MNKVISKYGTFIVIPPVLAIVAIIALRFNITTKADVTLLQTGADEIAVYLPADIADGDTLRIDTPEAGTLTLPVISVKQEPSAQRAVCSGSLPTSDTLMRATITTGCKPLYSILLHQNRL